MEILTKLVYVAFFINIFRWAVTCIGWGFLTHQQKLRANFKFDYFDNMFWVAPTLYFLV